MHIIADLFNKCCKESCFPDSWKVSFVVPVFKNVGERSYGFRSSRSIARTFNRPGATRAVSLDISKALDRVWHAGVLHKL